MSSLSAQMAALEKDSHKEEEAPTPTLATPDSTDASEARLTHQDAMEWLDSRAPPPSLRSDSELDKFFRSHADSTSLAQQLNDKLSTKLMTTPVTEPIQSMGRQTASEAMEREYDLDTWKMYHRINSARRPTMVEEEQSTLAESESYRSETDKDESIHQHDDGLEMDAIFELELDA